MTPILSRQKPFGAAMIATTTPARGRTENPVNDQARAIREQHEKRQVPRQETPQQARLRMQIEREQKQRPMTGGK